jgi:YesN/AraC family two-component response regulator
MNGFDFICKVKQFAPDKICLILSAFLRTDFNIEDAKQAHIHRYLNKPWRKQEVNNALTEALSLYGESHKT